MDQRLIIPGRFNGPTGSANGGYACGMLADRAAAMLGTSRVNVILHAPPPLDTELRLDRSAARVLLWDGERLVAVASLAQPVIDEAGFVALTDARSAEDGYLGLTGHPFPRCFVCGTDRNDGFGLRPGRCGEDSRTACVWRPRPDGLGGDGAVGIEAVWAALDCPGGWTIDLTATPMILNRMTTFVAARPQPDQEYVIVGRMDERGPRTLHTTTTLYQPDGTPLARAVATWSEFGPG